MAIFKCKICGGALEIDSAQSVATCKYCGTKQTLPRLDDERRANLYDRANHFRRNNDFDKAMGIFEQILNEEPTDAEAYWSIVLCRYGIEYVEDPTTRRRVPTVNRAQFTSIFDDEDYKSAIANADGYQREIYEAEANAINELQKNILAISQKEEPFDVFICYKETDNNGRRTQDSVLATELYHEVTKEGFKVFFSRITLEDKLGVAYEPYIFAALNSSKVMVVLGTRSEHFNAVWVKNEWSRYLALIKNGAKKTLIPAYRDMDPYDLPEEFSHLQAQDMSKLGFMQDLIRGVKKIVEADAPRATVKETIVTTAATINIAPLLKRAFMFLEDGDFDRADEFCEQVLNQDPENAQAYLGKLMVELRVTRRTDLADCAEPFDDSKTYQKALRFADSSLAADLKSYISTIKDRNARKAELARKESLYRQAMVDYHVCDIVRIQNALKIFSSLPRYKDSDERAHLCQSKIDQIRAEQARLAEEKRIADEKARLERQRREEIKRIEAEKRAKQNKKIAMIATPIAVAIIAFVIILNLIIIPNSKYSNAVSLMDDGKYKEAISVFEELDGYKDSETQIFECRYKMAADLMSNKNYEGAISAFEELDGYKDSDHQIIECQYKIAIELIEDGKYEKAKQLLQSLASSNKRERLIASATALNQIKNNKFEDAIKILLEANIPVELIYQTEGGLITSNEGTVFAFNASADFAKLETPNRNGYRFLQWVLGTYVYDMEDESAKFSLTLKAKWSTKDYSVDYDLVGGSINGANISEYDAEDKSFTLINPTRTGYTFTGWIGTDLSAPTITVTVPSGSYGDRSYTATWSANQYVVTYDAAGGSVSAPSQQIAYDADITYLIPERTGYKFLGWYENDTIKHEDEKWTRTSGLSLVAKWEIINYTIQYELNGGSSHGSNPSEYTVASDAITLRDPFRAGYTFAGWTYEGQTTPTMILVIEKGTVGNKKFTANWQANLNTVVFNSNTGNGTMANAQIETNATKSLPECTFTKKGYAFIGWATTPNGAVVYEQGASYTMGTDAFYTLYAIWEVIGYHIIYHLDGGIASNINTYTVHDNVVVTPPQKDGYTFLGWSGTGISNYTQNITIPMDSTGDREFTAHWESYLIYEQYGEGYAVKGVAEKYQDITEIRIPSSYNNKPVVSVNYLSGCNLVEKLIIPNNVTSIAFGAAKGFSALEYISLPFTGSTLRDDGHAGHLGWIFGDTEYSNSTVVITDSYYYIPNNLTSVNITNKLGTGAGDCVFKDCNMIKHVSIPSDTEKIAQHMFYGCSSLVNITDLDGNPLSVKVIEESAFSGCVNLKTHISARTVKREAFYNCKKITKFTFLEIPSENFGYIKEDYVFPNGPNYSESRVAGKAFYGCDNLSNIYVLDDVEKIMWNEYVGLSSEKTLDSTLLSNSSDLAVYLRNCDNGITCYAWY